MCPVAYFLRLFSFALESLWEKPFPFWGQDFHYCLISDWISMFKYMLFEAAINANSIPQKEEVGIFFLGKMNWK